MLFMLGGSKFIVGLAGNWRLSFNSRVSDGGMLSLSQLLFTNEV